MSSNEFGNLLKAFRLRAGYGLRRFAELIGEQPSNYSAIESGRRSPWATTAKLRAVADALALTEGSRDWDKFFITARKQLPPDVEHMLERDVIPLLLRTVDELRLTDEDLRELVEHLRERKQNAD